MKRLLFTICRYAPYFLLGPATRELLPRIMLVVLLLIVEPADALNPDALTQAAPSLNPEVAERAAMAVSCMEVHGSTPERLIVVDMSLHANQKRLWAFDVSMPQAQLLLTDWVAHGSGSDPNRDGVAERFSNRVDSHMTSLGAYRIAERYLGSNGWSRRLDGLMDGLNSKARERFVVMHPSNYVRPGSVGRSQGCPAVRQEVMAMLEREGLENALLWIDADDAALSLALDLCQSERWRRQSPWVQGAPVCRRPSPFDV